MSHAGRKIASVGCAAWLAVVAPALTLAADEPQRVPGDSRRAAVMGHHYDDALVVHRAVIRGDLAALKAPARALAAAPLPPGLPETAEVFVRRLRAAAQRAAFAPDIAAASAVTATMLATCGLCHDAMGTRPAMVVPDAPRVGGSVGHMLEHQRGLDLMLQGLVRPSTASWQDGVEALSRAPLRRADLPPDPKLASTVRAAERRVHDLAAEARTAASTSARATIYGRLLATCASCHVTHRTLWGPG